MILAITISGWTLALIIACVVAVALIARAATIEESGYMDLGTPLIGCGLVMLAFIVVLLVFAVYGIVRWFGGSP